MKIVHTGAVALAIWASVASAQAQSYPSHPVTLVVPYVLLSLRPFSSLSLAAAFPGAGVILCGLALVFVTRGGALIARHYSPVV